MDKKCRIGALMLLVFLECLGMGQQVEAAQTQMREEAAELTDLSEAFDVILRGATKEFIAGYVVDEAFLMWLGANYGEETVLALAGRVLDGELAPEGWYEVTGESIHVLWLKFCRDTGFYSYQLENVYWKECAAEQETVISFAGDFNLAEDWCTTEYMEAQPDGIYGCFSEELLELMNRSDIMVMNNEFTYTDCREALPGKAYVFRAEPEMAKLLSVFGTDAVTLANNHVFDYGETGLSDTLVYLKENGIPYSGAGETMEEAAKILYFVANGKKIALVSATEIERSTQYTREATDTHNGVLKTLNPRRFVSVIQEAKEHSDYVIAVAHWGTEGALYPDASQRYLAGKFAEAGADVIIGGHPHRLQGAGYVEGVPVAYSLGNFWFSDSVLYTTVAQVIIGEDGSLRLRYQPCIQKDLTTSLITDEAEKEEFNHYLAAISSDVWIDPEGNVYDKYAETEVNVQLMLDSDTCTTELRGYMDKEGNAIDIVGNLRKRP